MDRLSIARRWLVEADMSRVFPENSASLNLMTRMRFKEIGVHGKYGKLEGVSRNAMVVERLIPENID